MLKLSVCLAFVLFAVFLLKKGFNSTYVFFFLGLILAVIAECVTQTSVATNSSGVLAFDIFEAVKEQLAATFGSVGLSMLPIFGYSAYMNKIGASDIMGRIFSTPVNKAKNPYFVAVFVAIIVCGIMRIAIVSAFAIMALLFSTLYPAMLKAGLSKKTAISAIFLGTCFDWGPADFVIAQVLGGANQTDIAGYFLEASVYVMPIALAAVALVSGFIMKWWDEREGYVMGSDAPENAAESASVISSWYMILPLLPLILVIIFSKVFFSNISISVLTAVLISLIVSLVIELIRRGDIKARIEDMGEWLKAMGEGFGNLLLMVAAIQFFAGMLAKIGGFTYLMELVMRTGVSGWLLVFLIGVLVMILAVLMGDATAVTAVLAGQIYTVATAVGIPFYAAILPVQTVNSFRCLSIGTGVHTQYCAKHADCTPLDILRRCSVPCVFIFLISFFGSMTLLG